MRPHKEALKKLDRGERQEQYALSYRDVMSLLTHCEGLKDQVIIGLMAFAGLRLGEVQHLEASWINFGERTITIPTSCPEKWYSRERPNKSPEDYEVWMPKTVASRATLPILRWGEDVFYRILYRYFIEDRQVSVGLCAKSIYNRVVESADRARLKHVHPHTLRHTFKRLLRERGILLEDIMKLMRHKSISTTDLYGKIRDEEFCKRLLGGVRENT